MTATISELAGRFVVYESIRLAPESGPTALFIYVVDAGKANGRTGIYRHESTPINLFAVDSEEREAVALAGGFFTVSDHAPV